MNWLQEQTRGQVTKAELSECGQNILSFPTDMPGDSRYDTSSALDVVSQAAGAIRSIQDRAVETELHAKALVETAIEKLRLAEARIHSAEAERGQAQADLSKLSARLQEAERELAGTQSRIATVESELAKANQYMRAAETRAINAEKAVSQIDDAIRTKLIGLQTDLPACRAA